MIKNLIKFKVPSLTGELSFNILLHVVILFTILSIFFTKYVCKVSSNIINQEIKNIINDGVKKLPVEINNTLVENITLQSSSIEQFENVEDNSNKSELIDKIKQTYDVINDLKNKENIAKTIPYDYYVDLFSKEDITRQSINDEIFFYIKFTNILLIVFLISFLFYLVNNNLLNIDQIKHICLENILTFILVGIVEFLFFTNVAIKYIPTYPSLMFTSFYEDLKKLT